MPIASIIVPVYNGESYLRRCINSILAQCLTDLELILIDDGSTDRSGKICDRYSKKDSRIRVIHQKNQGVSAARNAGISLSQGNYVLFVDCDDYILPEYIQTLCAGDFDLTLCGVKTLDHRGNFLYQKDYPETQWHTQPDFPGLYQAGMLYSPYGKAFRGEILRTRGIRFPEGIHWGEDGMFVADYLAYAKTLQVSSYVGYIHISYPGEKTLSTKISQHFPREVQAVREYCAEKMKTTAPVQYDAVAAQCRQDIFYNWAEFACRVLSSSRNDTEKAELLSHFTPDSGTIPKVIHYCWFGGAPLPELAKQCIASWKKYCPDYILQLWTEENFDLNQCPLYVRQAYESKKWAFVTDYVRLKVVYDQGGIYLDTDVELKKSLTPLLSFGSWFGFENTQWVATGLGFGAGKGSSILKALMEDYENIPFVTENGYDLMPCPQRNTRVFQALGLKPNGTLQLLQGNICILPPEFLSPICYETGISQITGNTISVHHYAGSWQTPAQKQAVLANRRALRRRQIRRLLTQKPLAIAKKLLGINRYAAIRQRFKK